MFTDMLGERRYKINLHTHTRRSDGRVSAWLAARTYKEAGYDAIAITDHWVVGMDESLAGLPILPGCEYNFGIDPANEGVYHILSILHEKDPGVKKTDGLQTCIDKILAAGGIPVLAHPAWSLNDPSEVSKLRGIDFTETCAFKTASLSYSGASLSSKDIASAGHAGRQSPNPSQKFSRTSFAFPPTISIAPS